jgi:hypothetical protein
MTRTAGTLGALPHVPFSSDLETLNVLVDDWIRLSDEYFSFNCIQSSQARSTLFYFRVWIQRLVYIRIRSHVLLSSTFSGTTLWTDTMERRVAPYPLFRRHPR